MKDINILFRVMKVIIRRNKNSKKYLKVIIIEVWDYRWGVWKKKDLFFIWCFLLLFEFLFLDISVIFRIFLKEVKIII